MEELQQGRKKSIFKGQVARQISEKKCIMKKYQPSDGIAQSIQIPLSSGGTRMLKVGSYIDDMLLKIQREIILLLVSL